MSGQTVVLQLVKTSSPDQSIWRMVAEKDFREHLVALEERTNAVPVDVETFQASACYTGNIDDTPLRLTFSVEQQVADDLAFVAAVKEGAQSVAAVCLEQHLMPEPSLKIVVAAADTVDRAVQENLASILDVLMRVASRDQSHDLKSENEILSLIVALHKDKILGRLRSSKWAKPKYLALTHKKALWQDFANVIHRAQHVYPTRKERRQQKMVEGDLTVLATCYEQFEQVPEAGLLRQLEVLIKSTYAFCKLPDIQDFMSKLENINATTQIAASRKCLHQIEKIGAYWRIAKDLVSTARCYPHLFFDVELHYLAPYESTPTTIAYETWAKTCHVHAEVQLIVHYDLKRAQEGNIANGKEILWPRVIGTSKYLCYLCSLFIKFHGRFFAANTHGRLYDQWTVPDLKEYDETTRTRYAEVLKAMDNTICCQTKDEICWRPEPMTSRQNLLSKGYDALDDGR